MALNVGFIANPQSPRIDVVDPIEQQTRQIQLRQLLSGEQDERSQREAMRQSGGDASKYLQALASGGNYKAYQAAQKAALEGRKEEADITYKGAQTGKLLTEREELGIKSHRDSLAGVNDPQTAAAWLQSGYTDPVIGKRMASLAPLEQAISRIPQDPAGFQQWKQQAALGATKYIEMNKPSYQTRNLGGTTDTLALPGLGGAPSVVSSMRNTQSPDSLASQATQRRGQDLVDARSRESTSAAMSKPFEITGEDGKPVLVQQDKQGNIRPVQGYNPKQGASKPLTDSQSKALLFGSRMQEAGSVIDSLAEQGTTKSIPGSRLPIVGGAVTAMSGESNQKLEQAKRDFINATLRRESGAVISTDEFDNGEKQYFPQIGDAPAVIAQKRRNREVATRGILAEVPDSENRVSKVRGKPTQTGVTGDFTPPAKTKAGASVSNW